MRPLKILLLVILFLHLSVSAQEKSSIWEALFTNQPEEAQKLAVDESADNLTDSLKILEGIYQSQLMQNKFVQAYSTLEEMTARAVGTSLQALFLIRLGFEAERSGQLFAYYKFIDKLAQEERTGLDPYASTVLAVIRNRELLNKNEFTEAQKELLLSSRIDKVSKIIGPVYMPQQYGVELNTKVEYDLTTLDYNGYNGVSAGSDSRFGLSDILPDDNKNGVAYLYITVRSENNQKAVLDLVSNFLCKVWVNGYLVNSPDLYHEGYISARAGRIIELHKGKNLILIKAKRSDTLYLGLRDAETGGRLQEYEILPYVKEDWQDLQLKRYSGRIYSKKYDPAFITELINDNSPAAVIWKLFYYSYTRDYKNALILIDSLLEKYPQSALVLFKAGELYKSYFNVFESSEKVRIECENYIRRSLMYKDNYILAESVMAELLLGSKQENSALKILKKISRDNPHYPAVYKMLSDIYLNKGWLSLSTMNIEKYNELFPGQVYKSIKYYLDIEEYAKAENLFETAIRDNSLKKYEQYEISAKLQQFSRAEIYLKEWHKAHPQQIDKFLSEMVDLNYLQGKYDEVEKYLLEKIRKNPDAPGIEKALAINSLRLNKKSEAVQWMRELIESGIAYGPESLQLLSRIEADSDGVFTLKDYDIQLESIKTDELEKKDYAQASYANVVRVKVQRVFDDLSTEEYRHNAYKIFDQQAVSQLAELDVGAGEVLSCRTINPDGTEYIPESSENLALDKAISMYGVKPESILDYSMRYISGKKKIFDEEFEFADFDNPVIKSKFVLILPVHVLSERLSITQSKSISEPEIQLQGDEVVIIWEGKEEAGVEPENYMPAGSKVLPTVKIRIYSSDEERPDLITGSTPILTSSKIDETARTLIRESDSIETKVQTVYRWIAENIKVNNKINSARGAFTLKSGSVAAKMLLMQAMLKALNIESYPALCNIGFSVAGALEAQDRLESAAEFTWPMLLRIKNAEKPDIWVQISNDMRDSSMDNIGKMTLGAMTLERSAYGQRLGMVYKNLFEGINVLDEKIEINEDGSADVWGGVEFFGESAARVRQVFYNSENLRRYLAQLSSQLFPRITGVEYEHPELSDIEKAAGVQNNDLAIICKGKVLNYCNRKGDGLYLNPLDEDRFIGDLIVKQPRKHDIDIRMDIKNVISREFIIPQGFVFSSVPNDRVVKSSFGLFIIDYTVDKRTLKISASLLIPNQLIKAATSQLYNDFLQEVKNAVGQGIGIEKSDNDFGVEVLHEGIVQPENTGRFMIKKIPAGLEKIR